MCTCARPVTLLWLLHSNVPLPPPTLRYQEEEVGGVGDYQYLYLLAQQSSIRSKEGTASSPVFH